MAQGKEIGIAVSTTMKSGTADQNPMTLCQLKSRTLPRSLRPNSVTLRTCCRVHLRGNHR